jgi:hypothetical protein
VQQQPSVAQLGHQFASPAEKILHDMYNPPVMEQPQSTSDSPSPSPLPRIIIAPSQSPSAIQFPIAIPSDTCVTTPDGKRITVQSVANTYKDNAASAQASLAGAKNTPYQSIVTNACQAVLAAGRITKLILQNSDKAAANCALAEADVNVQFGKLIADGIKDFCTNARGGASDARADVRANPLRFLTQFADAFKGCMLLAANFGDSEHNLPYDFSHIDARMQQQRDKIIAIKERLGQSIDALKKMTLQDAVRGFFHHGLLVAYDGLALKVILSPLCLAAKAGELIENIEKVQAAFRKEPELAHAVGVAAGPMQNLAQSANISAKLTVEEGEAVAKKTLETLSRNPQLAEGPGGLAGGIEKARDSVITSGNSGTVWDYIKMTDPMYENTRIPKSFVLTTEGNKKFWINPNATDHMRDYIRVSRNISHGMPMNSQSLLSSLKSAIETAVESGIPYTE